MNDKLIYVETISYFKVAYVVRCKEESHASDEVLCNSDIAEFSQKHIDESIISTREITEEEYLKLFDKENDYLSSWNKDMKFTLINTIDYD